MAENDNYAANASLFKECYDLAAQYEQLDAAKNILRDKSKKIRIADGYDSVQTQSSAESDMQILSEALYELALEGYAASDSNRSDRNISRVSSLPDSGEKEYLLALISLRNRTDETARNEALNHISRALAYSPNDPRYFYLSQILMNPRI